jgi:hypothetical protein
MLQQPRIAGAILPDKLNFLQIRGIQLEGRLIEKIIRWANMLPVNITNNIPLPWQCQENYGSYRLIVLNLPTIALDLALK